MKFKYLVAEDMAGNLWVKVSGKGRAKRGISILSARKRLHRTRRQIYRYLDEGNVSMLGKFLGQWILAEDSVERLAQAPLSIQPVPSRMKVLFPEYELSDLNVGRDFILVLSRVLERGSMSDIRWLIKRYEIKVIRQFMERDAFRLLSGRAFTFWSKFFGTSPKASASWRRDSNPWSRLNQ